MTTITLDLYPLHKANLKGHGMEMSRFLNGNQPKIISIFYFTVLTSLKCEMKAASY